MVDLAASSSTWSSNPFVLHQQRGLKRKQQEELQQQQRESPVVISQEEEEEEESYEMMENDDTERMWDRRCTKRICLSPTFVAAAPSFSFSAAQNNHAAANATSTMTPFHPKAASSAPLSWVSLKKDSKHTLMQYNNTAAANVVFASTSPSSISTGKPGPVVEWWKKTRTMTTIQSSPRSAATLATTLEKQKTCFVCLYSPSSSSTCATDIKPQKANKNSLLSYFTPKNKNPKHYSHSTHSTPATSTSTKTHPNYPLTKCAHCDRSSCANCTKTCTSCQNQFCTFCSTVNYDLNYERVFCSDCGTLQHQTEEEDTTACCDMEI